MKKISDWPLIIIGKMPVVLAERMNIFGIKPSANYMALAKILHAVAKNQQPQSPQQLNQVQPSRCQQKQLLRLNLAPMQIKKVLLNN